MRKTRLLSLLVLLMTAATSAWADVWTDIIINGDLEGADRQCFFVKENGIGNGNVYYARIKDGIGVDNSRAIEVQSTGTEAQTWDTQFFVRLPYELPANTPYRVSFDYKADKTGNCDLQCQNEPGEYIWYTIGVSNSAITFGNGWSTFNSGEITVPEQCDGLQNADGPHLNNYQTISFSLGINGEATKYIIDNIKVEIPSDVLSGLTKKPLTKEMSQYPVEITSMAIMGDFLGQGEVNNWNPTNGWALTQDNSNPAIWKLTREFTAVARTYEYKIFANGNMDDFTLPVPAADKGQFVISEAGDYTLTVTVDTEVGTASVRAAVPGSYTVKMKDGTDDITNWSLTPTGVTTTGVASGSQVTLTYSGEREVEGLKCDALGFPKVLNLQNNTIVNGSGEGLIPELQPYLGIINKIECVVDATNSSYLNMQWGGMVDETWTFRGAWFGQMGSVYKYVCKGEPISSTWAVEIQVDENSGALLYGMKVYFSDGSDPKIFGFFPDESFKEWTLGSMPETNLEVEVEYEPLFAPAYSDVTMKPGTVDADKWTITPNTDVMETSSVALTYSGEREVRYLASEPMGFPILLDKKVNTLASGTGEALFPKLIKKRNKINKIECLLDAPDAPYVLIQWGYMKDENTPQQQWIASSMFTGETGLRKYVCEGDAIPETWNVEIHIGDDNTALLCGLKVYFNDGSDPLAYGFLPEDDTFKSWTLYNMPNTNPLVEVVYVPEQAAFATEGNEVLTPKAAEGVIAGTDEPIIEEGTVAKIGQSDNVQGTVMYAVTTTADAAPALDAFSATVPTAEDYDDATTVFVWYYIQGADAPEGQTATVENTFRDSEICSTPLQVNVLSNKFTLTFDPAPVEKVDVTVDGQAATPAQDGKLENVPMGKQVKVTAKTGYKLKKVEVKKGSAAAKTITIGDMELTYADGDKWETIVSKNSDKIKIFSNKIVQLAQPAPNQYRYIHVWYTAVKPSDFIEPSNNYQWDIVEVYF